MPDRRLLQVDVCFNLACDENVVTPLKETFSIEISNKRDAHNAYYVQTR